MAIRVWRDKCERSMESRDFAARDRIGREGPPSDNPTTGLPGDRASGPGKKSRSGTYVVNGRMSSQERGSKVPETLDGNSRIELRVERTSGITITGTNSRQRSYGERVFVYVRCLL